MLATDCEARGFGGRSFTVIHFLNRIPSSDVPFAFLSTTAHKADGSSYIYIYIYELFGKRVRARGGLEVASGGGWGLATEEEEPSVSLQTPPRVAYFKCSLVSSATADTGPQGKLEKQMEAGRGEPGEVGGGGF